MTDILTLTGGIVAVITAVSRLIAVYRKGAISRVETEQGKIAAEHKRMADIHDDLREDNLRLRKVIQELHDENARLRRVAEEAWEQANRRRTRRDQ